MTRRRLHFTLRAVATLALPALLLPLTSCANHDLPVQPMASGPQFEIQDGAHNSENGDPLTPSADTYLREGAPNQNQGTETSLRLQNSGNNRALLMWDPTVISQAIGAGTLMAARIELTISDNGDNWGTSGRTIDLHPMTRAWTETGATWNCAEDANPINRRPDCADTTAWEMGPPDSAHPWVPTPTATLTIHNGDTGVVTFDVTADVAGIVTGGGAQYGWILKKTNERANGRVEFGSRESASGPRLVLTVHAAPAVGSWIQLLPSSPSLLGRSNHTAVRDSSTNRMIVFGGFVNGVGPLNDVWILTNADGDGGGPSWIELFPLGSVPPARWSHTAVYDQNSNRMIVFGGVGDAGALGDIWVLINANGIGGVPTWVQLAPTGIAPAARFYHSAVYDAASNRMIVMNGANLAYPSTDVFDDVWVLTDANGTAGTSSWIQLSTSGTPPVARYLHTAVYDPTSNRMTAFGGTCLSCQLPLDDVWVLSSANGIGGTPVWTHISPTGAIRPARYRHSAVYDPASRRMIVFGGSGGYGLFNDVWVLTNADGSTAGSSWSLLAPTGTAPVERYGHSAVYDPASRRMTVFGGLDGNLRDAWVLTNANGIP